MPNNFSQADRENLLHHLKVGIQNAITATQLSNLMGFNPGATQVAIRQLIKECIEIDNDLILSCNRGFYLADTINLTNFEHYLNSLESRASEILSRRNSLIDGWNKQILQNPTSKRPKQVI